MANKGIRPVDIKEIKSSPDLLRLTEEVRASGQPCVLRKDGEDLALAVSITDSSDATDIPKSRRFKKHLLSLAGAWSDLDADAMIAEINTVRHAAPSSQLLDQ